MLLITIIILILALFSAFLNGIISALSFDVLSKIEEWSSKHNSRLKKLISAQEDSTLSFMLIEMLLYVCCSVFTGAYIVSEGQSWQYSLIAIILLFITIIVIRTFLLGIGIRYSEKLVVPLYFILNIYIVAAKPFVFLTSISKKTIGNNQVVESSLGELDAIVETAHEEGSLEAGEYRILKNIMHFSDVVVSDVMTPRTVVFSCEANKTVSEVIKLAEIRMYSRIPIWEGKSLDEGAVGYVMSKDILYASLTGKDNQKLKELSREIIFIPENAGLDTALDRFLKRRQHIFLVVDEYGGIEGLLTMEDVMETILGVEIVDEADKVADLRELAKQHRDRRIATITSRNE